MAIVCKSTIKSESTISMKYSQIAIVCNEVNAGWSPFTLTLDEREFACSASYLDQHPISSLLILLTEISEFFISVAPKFTHFEPEIDNPNYSFRIADEPGGFVINLGGGLPTQPAELENSFFNRVNCRFD